MKLSFQSNNFKKLKYINKCNNVFCGEEIDDKEEILFYLKSFKPRYATSAFVYDEIKHKTIEGIYDVGYDDGTYYWDGKDIYHLENYNMPLNSEFIKYVLKT